MNNKSCPSGRGSEGHFQPIALGELFVGGDLGHETRELENHGIFSILRMVTMAMQIAKNTKLNRNKLHC